MTSELILATLIRVREGFPSNLIRVSDLIRVRDGFPSAS